MLAAPLYLAGYWHLSQNLRLANALAARAFLFIGGYSFVVGAVWLGQRAFLAHLVQAIDEGLPLTGLLETFAGLNEPLVDVLRAAVLINSVLWVAMIAGGRSRYPRWMALFSPFAMLALIFLAYFAVPVFGRFLLPGAMNVVHVILFGLSLATTSAVR